MKKLKVFSANDQKSLLINYSLPNDSVVEKPLIHNQGRSDEKIELAAVIALPGYMNGLYYSSNTLEESAKKWKDIPVIVYHVKDSSGKDIGLDTLSTNDRNNRIIGHISNCNYSSVKNGLVCRLIINKDKCQKTDNLATYDLLANSVDPVPVSTGLYSDRVINQNHVVEVKDIEPDHLAILPDIDGACSVSRGCGTMFANQDDVGSVFSLRKVREALANLNKYFLKNGEPKGYASNESMSLEKIRSQLVGYLEGKFGTEGFYPYVTDVVLDSEENLAGFFVYELKAEHFYSQKFAVVDGKTTVEPQSQRVEGRTVWTPFQGDENVQLSTNKTRKEGVMPDLKCSCGKTVTVNNDAPTDKAELTSIITETVGKVLAPLLANVNQQRSELVANAAKVSAIPEEQLKALPDNVLVELAKAPAGNFSGNESSPLGAPPNQQYRESSGFFGVKKSEPAGGE